MTPTDPNAIYDTGSSDCDCNCECERQTRIRWASCWNPGPLAQRNCACQCTDMWESGDIGSCGSGWSDGGQSECEADCNAYCMTRPNAPYQCQGTDHMGTGRTG